MSECCACGGRSSGAGRLSDSGGGGGGSELDLLLPTDDRLSSFSLGGALSSFLYICCITSRTGSRMPSCCPLGRLAAASESMSEGSVCECSVVDARWWLSRSPEPLFFRPKLKKLGFFFAPC